MPVRMDCRMCGFSGDVRSSRKSCPRCACRLLGSTLIVTPAKPGRSMSR